MAMAQRVDRILNEIRSLGHNEYRDVMIRAFDGSRPAEIQKAVVNGIRKKGSRNASQAPPKGISDKEETGVDAQGTLLSWPSLPCGTSTAAWNVPFIYRGDLVPDGGFVFIDVEKLTLKTDSKNHQQVACVVAVVNEKNDLIFWSFIKPENEVCQYFKNITGVDKAKLELGLPMKTISYFASLCFEGNIVIGYDLDSDLNCMDISKVSKKEDLADYFVENKRASNSSKLIQEKYSLKDLSTHFFKNTIQCAVHSAIIDARTTRDLWIKKKEILANQPVFSESVTRSKKPPYKFDRNDLCTCPNTKTNLKRQNRICFPTR